MRRGKFGTMSTFEEHELAREIDAANLHLLQTKAPAMKTKLDEALTIIAKAEKDLGKLSDAQRRDLLYDNTEWNFETVTFIVMEISGGHAS